MVTMLPPYFRFFFFFYSLNTKHDLFGWLIPQRYRSLITVIARVHSIAKIPAVLILRIVGIFNFQTYLFSDFPHFLCLTLNGLSSIFYGSQRGIVNRNWRGLVICFNNINLNSEIIQRHCYGVIIEQT